MQQMFGSSFSTIYGEVPPPLWENAVSKLTDDECRAGLSTLAKEKREYPANLTEFMEACRPKRERRFNGVPVNPATLRLDRPAADRAHIDACLASMRAKLGRPEPEPERTVPPGDPQLSAGCTCGSRGTCATCRAWLARTGGEWDEYDATAGDHDADRPREDQVLRGERGLADTERADAGSDEEPIPW